MPSVTKLMARCIPFADLSMLWL